MKKKKSRKQLPGEGSYFEFHGAFKSQAAARRRAKARGGFEKARSIRGSRRYVVMVPRESPF